MLGRILARTARVVRTMLAFHLQVPRCWQTPLRELTMVLWSPPHQADSFRNLQTQQKEPATVRLVLHFSRKVWSMINLQ